MKKKRKYSKRIRQAHPGKIYTDRNLVEAQLRGE
jgi:hypothetical protein